MKNNKYLILILILCIICVFVYRKIYSYYSPAKERSSYQITVHNDDTLRIAYIGDSWAEMHRNHQCLIPQLIIEKMNRPIKLSSHGLSGRTSKEIYEYLFNYPETHDFMRLGYDYCFISAGINDCNKKMSTEYYKKSMDCIIQFMLTNIIHPIILEIPDYDIQKVYKEESMYNQSIRKLSMLINGTSIDCKQEYRNALDRLIQDRGYQDRVSVIRYKSWNKEYENDLKELYIDDHLHLNKKGYAVLDSCIATEIINTLQSVPDT